jgi:hypothetical protein
MRQIEFAVIDVSKDTLVYVVGQKSNDRTQAKDISALAKKYREAVGKNSGVVVPLFVISKDYDENTKDFHLFIGGLNKNESLEAFVIPKGLYGKTTIKPRFGFMWGLSIGDAKRAFYTQWLPKSNYTALNIEYEHHTEISTEKKPQIEILFAVKALL